jgi:DNA repair protein RadC
VEIGRRVAMAAARRADARFPSSAAVDGWARPRIASLDHEELWALVLDGHQGLRAARLVARGGLHGLHVGARDPLRLALRDGGSAFVLVHNHPSGDPSASEEDVRFTAQVARAGDVVGLPLLDHVIVARGGYKSLLDDGLLRSTHEALARAKSA